ncbi:hypothetical protein GIB67_034180 [Kingdonia uniflora]|uniref:DRBM domain-containing protein n=1 Tax=Kingdonia uniflora TaxID=39325 RepID=A0A7J7NS88_9MAGN|nr:hypothetical protein GIB67_034180 [Kingdonia uniflora]
MYKSRLNELCHQNQWGLPHYKPTKHGPDHTPSFKASVIVNGLSFDTPISCQSSKEAQNEAARIAFQHFTVSVQDPLTPFQQFGSSSDSIDNPRGEETLSSNQEISINSSNSGNSSDVKDGSSSDSNDKQMKNILNVYKSRLNELCHQNIWTLPNYKSSREGPDHNPSFKASVLVNGVSFGTPVLCKSSKEAQNEAARIAFQYFTTPASDPLPPPLQFPSIGASSDNTDNPMCEGTLSSNQEVSSVSGNSLGVKDGSSSHKQMINIPNVYKSRLHELCLQSLWSSPKFDSSKDGPDHNPSFKASVLINGVSFNTSISCKSSKEAQNEAARIAFQHFTTQGADSLLPPQQCPSIGNGKLFQVILRLIVEMILNMACCVEALKYPLNYGNGGSLSDINDNSRLEAILSSNQELSKFSSISGNSLGVKDGSSSNRDDNPMGEDNVLSNQKILKSHSISGNLSDVKDDLKSFPKNQLQSYAQKKNLSLPVYSCTFVGPSNDVLFKPKVTVGGQTFESSDLFCTLKEAEHAAAGVALSLLLIDGMQEASTLTPIFLLFFSLIDSGFYKNLLLELVVKEGFALPKYDTVISGESHLTTFISTVKIEDEFFRGVAAKTKKQAEINAAKLAYSCLKQCRLSRIRASVIHTDQPEELSRLTFSSSTAVVNVDGRTKREEQICGDPLISMQSIRCEDYNKETNSGDQEVSLTKTTPSPLKLDTTSALENTESPSIIFDNSRDPISKEDETSLSSSATRDQKISLTKTTSSPLKLDPTSASENSTGFPSIIFANPRDPIHEEDETTLSSSATRDQEVSLTMTTSSPLKLGTTSASESTVSPSIIFAKSQDPISKEDETSSSSSATNVSECSDISVTNVNADVLTGTKRSNTVRVCPRRPDMSFPEGASVLPFSDEKWVALSFDHPKKRSNN